MQIYFYSPQVFSIKRVILNHIEFYFNNALIKKKDNKK